MFHILPQPASSPRHDRRAGAVVRALHCTKPDADGRQRGEGIATVKVMMWRAPIVGFLLLAAGPLNATDRLALKVSPAVSFAPANLIVRTTVIANADNRAMEVSAESEEFYRASEVQLDGERAPRVTTFEFRSLPSGIYEVRATLFSGDGHARALVRQSVNVIASAGGR